VLFRIRDRNIWVIYAATLLLGTGYGISISLVSLHLDVRGFSKADIGTLAASFASGIVLFSLPMGAMIRRFSAKRTLVTAMIGYAAAVMAFPWLETYAGVATARFCDGAFSAGIWVSCETILLSRAEPGRKAFVTSLYAIAMSIGYVIGPIVAKGITSFASMPVAFSVSGGLALTAALLVTLMLDKSANVAELAAKASATASAPAAPAKDAPAPSALELLSRIKCACFATFAYGYFQASVVLFLPLYLIEEKGISRERTILVPAFFAAGMLLFSNVAGRVGDRVGHLLVMRVLGFLGMLMILGFVFLDSYGLMCTAVFVAGATLASISPVSLALQGVVVPAAHLHRSNAIYNVFYALGMLLGPPASSVVYTRLGGAVMLEHLAALWVLFVVFTWVFAGDDPASPRHVGSKENGLP
jgi:MFS family permease